jgi:amino acid adenylation domain-containing protein
VTDPSDPLDLEERSNLTRQQLLLWLGQKLHPDEPRYHVAHTFAVSGPLKPAHLGSAFRTLVNSSDAWRTVFEETDGVPRQRVREPFPCEMASVDLSALPDPEAAGRMWLDARWRTPFTLGKRLVDSALVKLAEDRFVWALTLHHLVTDGWSDALAFREISDLYQRSLDGRLEPTVPLPAFQDYLRWEREERASPRRREAEAYWARRAEARAEPLAPYGGARPEGTGLPHRLARDLGAERSQALRTLATHPDIAGATAQASLFQVLAAALYAYLYRVTGQAGRSIGVSFHNREQGAFRGTLGLFMSTLPVQVTIERADTFLALARKVREALSALRPFRGVALANPRRRRLYDVVLNLYRVTVPAFRDTRVRWHPLQTGPGLDALTVEVRDFGDAGGLELALTCGSNVFTEAETREVLHHLLRMLDAMVDDPRRPVGHVSLVTEAEGRRAVVEWNDTRRDYPGDRCLHELFEEQVARTPETTAVVFEDARLSYRELDRRANRLARHLRRLGVMPESLVGLGLERSADMIVGMLAVLKAGAAYVPLDPAHPAARVAFMLEDAGIAVVLSRRRLAKGWLPDGVRTVCLDTDWPAVAREDDTAPERWASPAGLAYVIYTSGSTGAPKGVLVEHRQILNYVQGIQERCGIEPGASFAMVQPLAVDSSQTVIFPALVSGGCLHVIAEERAADPRLLGEYFRRWPIDLLKIAPSHLAALLHPERPEPILPRRWLVIGGEASRWDLIDRLHAIGDCAVFNHYGPTETTVGVLTYPVPREADRPPSATVPIGRPLPNVRAYLLDGHGRPVPVGVPGELYLGGRCLARGYLNRPALTAERFVPDPFGEEPGARLYQTGDLCRYLPDGAIEFLGRVDDQVKIRGFRIEPGEVEAALGRHPGVRECAVVAQQDGDAPSPRLVAHVVREPRASPTARELRAFARERLPDHMVPSLVVFVDALPRTPHGKLDRRALPAASAASREEDDGLAAPRDAVEQAVAEIWAQVLRRERIGIQESFFDLGGDSLLATQVILRARNAFGVEVSLRAFFATPTVAALAEAIRRAGDGASDPP